MTQWLWLLKQTPEGVKACPLYDVAVSQVVRTTTETNARLIAGTYGYDECTEHPEWWNNPIQLLYKTSGQGKCFSEHG